MQEKVLKLYDVQELSAAVNNTNAEEALSALEVLGFVRKTTEKVVKKIVDQNAELTVEQIIKLALKGL